MSHAGAESLPDADSGMSEMVPLADASRIGEARRMAHLVGVRAGLDSHALSNLGLIVNELASNAVRHATGGFLLVRVLHAAGRRGVEVLCIDRGPGMANVAESMRDGFSTAGSMGTGLGAARRIASTLDVHSAVGSGTVVLARVWGGGVKPATSAPLYASICRPYPGERACGDRWGFSLAGARAMLFAVDGLGHGPSAEDAAQQAVRIFRANAERKPAEVLDRLDRGLRSTRGAAAAVTEVDFSRKTIRHAGIGNIAGWIVGDKSMRAMVSHNGILGHQIHRLQEFEYPLPPEGLVILHSDGLTSKWKIDTYPGLLRRDVAIVAGVIYRDSVRDRDDSSILVYRPPTLESRHAVQ